MHNSHSASPPRRGLERLSITNFAVPALRESPSASASASSQKTPGRVLRVRRRLTLKDSLPSSTTAPTPTSPAGYERHLPARHLLRQRHPRRHDPRLHHHDLRFTASTCALRPRRPGQPRLPRADSGESSASATTSAGRRRSLPQDRPVNIFIMEGTNMDSPPQKSASRRATSAPGSSAATSSPTAAPTTPRPAVSPSMPGTTASACTTSDDPRQHRLAGRRVDVLALLNLVSNVAARTTTANPVRCRSDARLREERRGSTAYRDRLARVQRPLRPVATPVEQGLVPGLRLQRPSVSHGRMAATSSRRPAGTSTKTAPGAPTSTWSRAATAAPPPTRTCSRSGASRRAAPGTTATQRPRSSLSARASRPTDTRRCRRSRRSPADPAARSARRHTRRFATQRGSRHGRAMPTFGGHAPRQSAALPFRGRSGPAPRVPRGPSEFATSAAPAPMEGPCPPSVDMPRGSRPRFRWIVMQLRWRAIRWTCRQLPTTGRHDDSTTSSTRRSHPAR